MYQNTGNYQQNYYQNIPKNYDEDYYENETEEVQGNCGDASGLQVPNVQLYPEGAPDVYKRNSPYYEIPKSMDTSKGSFGRPNTAGSPTEYYYNMSQPYNRQFSTLTATNDRLPSTQTKTNNYHLRHCYQYPPYEDEIYNSYQDRPLVQGTSGITDAKGMQDAYEEIYEDNIQHGCGTYQNQLRTCNFHQNCAGYNVRPTDANLMRSEYIKDTHVDYRQKRFYGYGNKVPKGAAVKKYPVTVKTPKYITKNCNPTTVSKRPSALCLPVITQPDPALVRKKSKTNHQIRKNPANFDPYSANMFDQNDAYSAHKMHSQGDVKHHSSPEGLEDFLDKFENNMVLNELDDLYDEHQKKTEANNEKFKEFTKFLKPRVPSSIKVRQEKLANTKSSKPLQPKLKLSLDKLLNRLQKCENNDEIEQEEVSYKTELENKDEHCKNSKEMNIDTLKSFNYETLARKCSPIIQDEDKNRDSGINSTSKGPVNSLLKPFDSKRSVRMIKPLDDHCALDLHRSKSYIVDLIDRALSKELGTVPRGQSVHHGLTPDKAVATISRHRPSSHKELCYEVTAALTDSFISSATVPNKNDMNQIVERSTSEGQIKETTSDDSYIKQLKQLRWGHIRHIQHEARKLADLEEFLEKCGEIE